MDDRIDLALHALSDGTRRRILRLLSYGERRVTDIASGFPMSLPAVSKHIRVMERAGLIIRRVEGRTHYLRAVPEMLQEVRLQVEMLQAFWGDQLEALDNYVNEEETMATYQASAKKVIQAPRERIFDVWLDPKSMNKWLNPMPGGSAKCETDPKVGGSYKIEMFAPDGSSIPHTGTYEVIDRPEKLQFTWNSPYVKDSRVTVTFAEAQGGTEVAILHELIPDKEEADKHSDGWRAILDKLAENHG